MAALPIGAVAIVCDDIERLGSTDAATPNTRFDYLNSERFVRRVVRCRLSARSSHAAFAAAQAESTRIDQNGSTRRRRREYDLGLIFSRRERCLAVISWHLSHRLK